MKARHWITAAVLLLLAAAAIVGMVRTRQRTASIEIISPRDSKGGKQKPAVIRALVDQSPLQTARRIEATAYAREEKDLAQQAEKIADHEVDLAFFDAFRTAQDSPPPLTPALKKLANRKTQLQQALQEDQANVAALTKRIAAASESQKENLQDQLNVAQAQLELDQDELDDATEALVQAGGDPQVEVQHQKQAHDDEETYMASHPASASNPAEGEYQSHTLLNLFRAWKALSDKKVQLTDAQREAGIKQDNLSQQHDALAAAAQQQSESRESARQQAKGFATSSKTGSRDESKATAQAALDSLKSHRLNQRNLADLARRMADEKKLNDIYGQWIVLVETRQQAALHNILEVLFWILLVMLIVYLANRTIEHFTLNLKTENKRVDTLRAVLKFSAQAIGILAILFLIFGLPSQTTTILGLAGAGLTVAMKDFIMAFLGWFSLMGRNGIHVGDWVEINGVAGEVVEIGLMKTVLLETGNWTDAGHPTGRKVSFMNNFAIEGHFFNFTTSGQWMWDELKVTIPASQDPYAVIDRIQKLVAKETETSARKAEEEWHATTNHYRVQAFSAAPALNVLPSGDGVEVQIRYITRAYERHEMRKRLYEAVVQLMHGKRETVQQ
ncbi:MAG TPA: mechanosensitive ion channel domain-containing protein [Candidatus Sulfotelmatobacter sp.]|nr:mechanosensitive ion channel domain-containing protein [Candidatus Sulfotelmatobacter sp.]